MSTEVVKNTALASLRKLNTDLLEQSRSRSFFCSDLKRQLILKLKQELKNILESKGTPAEKEAAGQEIFAVVQESEIIKLKMGIFRRSYSHNTTAYED